MGAAAVLIRHAAWPADESAAVALLRNYAAHLAAGPGGVCLDGYELELASLAERWSPPHGVLLLAFINGTPAGCVAVKVRHDCPGSCEMKRLWVEGHARGRGLGRSLTVAAIDWVRAGGAVTLLLDTLPGTMPQAVALYLSLGFQVTERHNSNPLSGLQFMRLQIT